jgi:hypothetical protein
MYRHDRLTRRTARPRVANRRHRHGHSFPKHPPATESAESKLNRLITEAMRLHLSS